MKLPSDSVARKGTPITSGVLDYFPLALAAVARLSKAGNDKHNPGQPLHWSREKSTDHADCVARHLIERGTIEPESGELHDVCQAWRSLAQCQLAEEKRLAAAERQEKCDPTNTTVGRQIGVTWGDLYTGSDVTNGCAMPPPSINTPPEPEWLVEGVRATSLQRPFTFWYLATPYSKYPAGHESAAILSASMAARLLEARVPTFSPIAHSHPISKYVRGISNTDYDFWINADAPFIKLASGLIVVTAEGWEESRGMAEEIKRFTAAGKPVTYWAPWCSIPKPVMDTALPK